MLRRIMRLALIGLLVSVWMFGFIHTPGAVRGASDDTSFSAAETVLSQSGTLGHWWLPQPPGFPPLTCEYPANPGFHQNVHLVSPFVYPVQGILSQDIRITLSINRRLPGGSLQLVETVSLTGTATYQSPFYVGGGGGWGIFGEDTGSTFVETLKIEWFAAPSVVMSYVELLYTHYQTTVLGSPNQVLPVTDACYPVKPATAQLGAAEGTVGSSIPFNIARFPHDPNVGIYFDGSKLGTVATDLSGSAWSSLVVPAAPMGKHTIKFYRYGRNATATYTVKPRIKVSPSYHVPRGSTVNVSLRGYAAHETVNIRWLKNGVFVHLAYVTTSSTSSANINVTVPKWVPDGSTSVRGDGSSGHAQTNAVSVFGGGPVSSSSVKPAPTATPQPSETATPAPTATQPSATATPQPTETVQTGEPPATETATPTDVPATETATAQPTETATPTIAPTEEPASPSETPTVEPTVVPSETVVP
jgi:hypothetical protein